MGSLLNLYKKVIFTFHSGSGIVHDPKVYWQTSDWKFHTLDKAQRFEVFFHFQIFNALQNRFLTFPTINRCFSHQRSQQGIGLSLLSRPSSWCCWVFVHPVVLPRREVPSTGRVSKFLATWTPLPKAKPCCWQFLSRHPTIFWLRWWFLDIFCNENMISPFLTEPVPLCNINPFNTPSVGLSNLQANRVECSFLSSVQPEDGAFAMDVSWDATDARDITTDGTRKVEFEFWSLKKVWNSAQVAKIQTPIGMFFFST